MHPDFLPDLVALKEVVEEETSDVQPGSDCSRVRKRTSKREKEEDELSDDTGDGLEAGVDCGEFGGHSNLLLAWFYRVLSYSVCEVVGDIQIGRQGTRPKRVEQSAYPTLKLQKRVSS